LFLSNSNFKVLGSFSGIATYKKNVVSIKQKDGIIAEAKANLLENRKRKNCRN